MTSDRELLRQYAESGDEAAFAEVVQRYLPLVYSAAWRLAGGNAQLAEDVAQGVFIDLARKAGALCGHETLAGWLHTSTRYRTSKMLRGERRRHLREQEAATMHESNSTPEINLEQLRPVLDEAVGRLGETDRNAVLLRFFQGKSYGEVAVALGLNENTVNKRVERALEKIREHFATRGVTTTAALLASAITANAMAPLPAGLAAKITSASLAGGGPAMVWGSFIMSTKTKIITAVAILAILAAIPVTLAWRKESVAVNSVQAGPSSPSAAKTTTKNVPVQPIGTTAPDVPPPSASAPSDVIVVAPEPVLVSGPAPMAWAIGAYVPSSDWADVGADTPEKAVQTFLWARKEGKNDRIIDLRFAAPIVAARRPDGQSSRPVPAGVGTSPRPANPFDSAKIAGTTVVARNDISPTEVEITVEDKFSEPVGGFGKGAKEVFNLQLADGVWKWKFTRLAPLNPSTARE